MNTPTLKTERRAIEAIEPTIEMWTDFVQWRLVLSLPRPQFIPLLEVFDVSPILWARLPALDELCFPQQNLIHSRRICRCRVLGPRYLVEARCHCPSRTKSEQECTGRRS